MFFALSPYEGNIFQPTQQASRGVQLNRHPEVVRVDIPNTAMAAPSEPEAAVNLRNINPERTTSLCESFGDYFLFAAAAVTGSICLGLMVGATTADPEPDPDYNERSGFNTHNFIVVTVGSTIIAHIIRGLWSCAEAEENNRMNHELFDFHNAHHQNVAQHETPPELGTHFELPATVTSDQLKRAETLMLYGMDQDFPLKEIEYDSSDTCPLTLKEIQPLVTNMSNDTATNDTATTEPRESHHTHEEDFIQKPVIILNETEKGYSAVFERNDLLSSWILTGEDPTNRQPLELGTLRSAEIVSSLTTSVDMNPIIILSRSGEYCSTRQIGRP